MANFEIDTDKMREIASNILAKTEDLNQDLDSLYKKVENINNTSGEWTGNSAEGFVNSVKVEKQNYYDLKNTLVDYANYLISEANNIDKAYNEVKL